LHFILGLLEGVAFISSLIVGALFGSGRLGKVYNSNEKTFVIERF
jgi:hypothetical protein